MIFQVNTSRSEFWNSLKVTWQQCADLPQKCWTLSVAEMDGKVYAAILDGKYAYCYPLMYDSKNDRWSSLPALPCTHFSLVTIPDKKQLLAIGGWMRNKKVRSEFSNKVFLWDEKSGKWITPYPKMPTARGYCSSISHGSSVIVAGGVTCSRPWTITRAVEVLDTRELTTSHWSVVEQLPHGVWLPIPIIINNELYLSQGYDGIVHHGTCNVITASLPELLRSSNQNSSSGQVWHKLPDMPYSSFSINHYQGRLITFSGAHKVERPEEGNTAWQSVPLIHIYNPSTKSWDCVGEIPYGYLLGRSGICIREDKMFFIGGLTGTYDLSKDDNIITTCSILTL